MGWSTTLFTSIEFYKKTYNSKYEVESDLEKSKNLIKKAKEVFTKLAFMTEPSKFCEENETPEEYIDTQLNEWTEILEEETINVYKLELLLDNWDGCHNKEGLGIEPPEGIGWESAFIDGDFIYTDKHPTQEDLLGNVINHKGEIVDDSKCIIDKNGKFKQ